MYDLCSLHTCDFTIAAYFSGTKFDFDLHVLHVGMYYFVFNCMG